MEKISFEQFKNKIKQGEKDFTNLILENMNLENYDLSDMNFSHSNFINANLSNVNFYSSQLVNVLLDDCNLQNANLKNANLERASLRRVNLTYADIRGAKLYAAVLENAILDNIIFDDKTENLIPSDARRVSSTMNCCRCDKAKVLEIKNFEGTKFFDEAWSTVAENFCYKLGEWVYAENFNEDRWYDSTGGIHFWMTEDEAKAY